ncbi:hypothetical protein IQ62_02000 [Streptomyces scabiei]|nr:hypothetical protein IQ62_02000 [Streptomyces scabiei]
MRSSLMPTRLLPAPMPANSSASTVCLRPAGSPGSTVSANRVFSVLAGGSLRCASCAASTAPLSASATSHDTAEMSWGARGAPGRGRTCVPGRYRDGGSCAALASRAPAPMRRPAPSGFVTTARAPSAQTAEQQRAARATRGTRDENPMVIPQT